MKGNQCDQLLEKHNKTGPSCLKDDTEVFILQNDVI